VCKINCYTFVEFEGDYRRCFEMKKMLQGIGMIVLIGMVVFGVLYLISSTGIAGNANPGSVFGQLIGGFQDALNGLQASISRMFANFTK